MASVDEKKKLEIFINITLSKSGMSINSSEFQVKNVTLRLD